MLPICSVLIRSVIGSELRNAYGPCARKPLGRKDRIIAFPWGNEDTQNLIDIFDQYNVKATFFVVGELSLIHI